MFNLIQFLIILTLLICVYFLGYFLGKKNKNSISSNEEEIMEIEINKVCNFFSINRADENNK